MILVICRSIAVFGLLCAFLVGVSLVLVLVGFGFGVLGLFCFCLCVLNEITLVMFSCSKWFDSLCVCFGVCCVWWTGLV